MGEFTQNLLKLTEFPFSYSLMGLLALIFGHGINPEELSFAKIGPLLILMGFVATTLSICDPVGTLQRLIIKGRSLDWRRFDNLDDLLEVRIFRIQMGHLFQLAYIIAIRFSAEDIKKKGYSIGYSINLDSVDEYAEAEKKLGSLLDTSRISGIEVYGTIQGFWVGTDLTKIVRLVEGLKQQTVKTRWITAEVDRMTALVYFIVVISVFIVATLVYPVFLQKFRQLRSRSYTSCFIWFRRRKLYKDRINKRLNAEGKSKTKLKLQVFELDSKAVKEINCLLLF